MGFGIPLNSWLRNQLYDWSIDIITNTDWENDLGLNKNVIVNHWNNFLKYGNPSATHIWILISLGAWYKRF